MIHYTFIGPLYPSDAVMNCINGIKININSKDTADSSRDIPAFTGKDYITNLKTTSDGVVSFTAVCHNPYTGEVRTIESTSPDVTTYIPSGVDVPNFNGGGSEYTISPCCVTWCTVEDNEPKTISVSCTSPLTASVNENELLIAVQDNYDLWLADAREEQEVTGVVKRINGIRDVDGDINIRCAGNMTVTISDVSKDTGDKE